MKIKVKGLVFVGFAAAILSANAMADPSGTTITSLAYTENTYQKINNMTTQGNETGNVLGTGEGTDAKYPSEKAVASAISAATANIPTYSNFTGATAQNNGAAGLVPAPTTADVNKVLGGNGNWIGAFGAATAGAAGTTGLVPAPAAGSQNKVLTGGGTWMGSFTGTNGTTAGTTGLVPAPTTTDKEKVLGGSGQWVDLPTVNDATLTVQLNGTSKGTFTANASSAATINIDGVEVTNNKLDGSSGKTIAANSSDTGKYPSAKAVYDFVTNQPSAGIPGKSSLCTASLPCALVAETSGFHWRVMAVSANQVPAAGTLADSCTANTDCPTGATCNTTGGANVCVES